VTDSALRRLHETWLGMVQPSEGLVFSPTVLADLGVGRPDEGPAQLQQRFKALCPPSAIVDGEETRPRIQDFARFLEELLGFEADLFDQGDALPPALSLDVPEANQRLRPTLALKKQFEVEVPEGTDATEAAKAGAPYAMLVWDLAAEHSAGGAAVDGAGLSLDDPEALTGEWRYPPTAKMDRLLRHVRVPIGLLTNRDELRLIYAPHGESTGHVTFRLGDMTQVGGRPILDALVSLLHVERFFGVDEDAALPALLAESRKRQANVTEELAGQVFDALQVLLAGFQAAAERDPDRYGQVFREALERDEDHVYRGLLTVMLRLVFLLFAEDRALLPVERSFYEEHFSVFALFARLQEEAGAHPDSMGQRFGAWGQLLTVFRAVFMGVDHGELHMPPRHGDLFDPHRYPFLEGVVAGASPLNAPELQAEVVVPTVDDAAVYGVLERLIVFDGQRLSYKALDVEQIGSVYEALMGYHVSRMEAPAVRMKSGQWVTVDEVLAVKPAQRAKWFKKEIGLTGAQSKKLKARFDEIASSVDEGLAQRRKGAKEDGSLGGFASLREAYQDALADYSAAGRRRDKSQVLARAGQLVLQPGAERRRTSSHYTPRSLSAPIVERTLEPLIRAMGETPTAEQLLELKVCDPAMGSGAFLVAACGYLGDQLVAAWTREGALEGVAEQAPNEDPVLYARRLVAQRCLYGVDKNEAAVELGKLSLWLFTLARDRPFTFLDHALRHGDSLVGLSFEQIRSFTWEPEAKGQQVALARAELDQALEEAIPIRQRILELAKDPSPAAQLEKEHLVRDATDALDRARLVGDVIVGAFFAETKKKAREKERERRWDLVQRWLGGDDAAEGELREMQAEIRARLPVFHWMLEFPEVFWGGRADPLAGWETDGEAFFDAFVGNPPFMGVSTLSGLLGPSYRDWLFRIHGGSLGKSDLVAHFFRRAAILLGTHGTLGLIATNTIAQGDTRESSLKFLLTNSAFQIYNAMPSMTWPGSASVTVAVVHMARGTPLLTEGDALLGGRSTAHINSRLRAGPERPDPVALHINAPFSFHGCEVRGLGFILDEEEKNQLVRRNPANSEIIRPYLGGQEVNTSPTQSPNRYVVDFSGMDETQARQWGDLYHLLQERVRPYRETLRRRALRERWWRFAEEQPTMRRCIADLDRTLVSSIVSKHLVFSFQPTDRVFSHKLYIFPLRPYTALAVLQSRLHSAWTWLLSSTMKSDLNYSASDCFDTFPFPELDPRTVIAPLEDIGDRVYQARLAYMVEMEQGLTQTYNRLKDPECEDERIEDLRRLHEKMDRAVLRAYHESTGDRAWAAIEVPPYCAESSYRKDVEAHAKLLERFNDLVIDRLFVLNAQRAEEERHGR